jgi:hypothetical protein
LRAEHRRSIAAGRPTILGSNQLTPCSAIRPRWAKAVVNTAESAAKRRSAYSGITKPKPAAGPLMAAMMNFGMAGKYE